MQGRNYEIGIVPWHEKSKETCLAYRRGRGDTVSEEEQKYLVSLFRDIYWFSLTVTMSNFVCHEGTVPSWAFAEQSSARRGMETYRYLVALYTRSGTMYHEVADLAIGLLKRTVTDPSGNTSVLEAMLTYGDTERTGEYTDRLVDEVFEALYGWTPLIELETLIDCDESCEIVAITSEGMKFGFRTDEAGFTRIAEGSTEAPSSDAFLLDQYRLVAGDVGPRRFHPWKEVARHMHPAIALRRVLIPMQLRLIDELRAHGGGGIGNCYKCADADQDYVDWTDGRGDAKGPKELVMRGGLSKEQAERTVSMWPEYSRTIAQLEAAIDPFAGS